MTKDTTNPPVPAPRIKKRTRVKAPAPPPPQVAPPPDEAAPVPPPTRKLKKSPPPKPDAAPVSLVMETEENEQSFENIATDGDPLSNKEFLLDNGNCKVSITEDLLVSQGTKEENENSVELFSAESAAEEKAVKNDQEDECEIVEDCWSVPKHDMGSFDLDFSRNDIYMFSAGNTLNENLIFQGNFESCPDDASNVNRQEEFSFDALENSSPLPPKIVDEVWKIPQDSQREESPDIFHKSTEPQPALIYRPLSPAIPDAETAAPSLPSSSPPLMPNSDSSSYLKFFTPMQFTTQVNATTRSINFNPSAEKKRDSLSNFLKSTLDSNYNLEASTSTEPFTLPNSPHLKEKICNFDEAKIYQENETTEEVVEMPLFQKCNDTPEASQDMQIMLDSGNLPSSPTFSDEVRKDEKLTYFGNIRSSQESSQEESTENSSSRELGEIFNHSSALEDKDDTADSDDDEFADCENNNLVIASESAPLKPLQIVIDETTTDFFGSICDDKSFTVAAISPRESGAESITQNFSDFTNDMLANDYTLIETRAKCGKKRLSTGEDILEKINEEPVAEDSPWALPKDDGATQPLDALGEEPNAFVVDWSHLSEDAVQTKEEEQVDVETESEEISGPKFISSVRVAPPKWYQMKMPLAPERNF